MSLIYEMIVSLLDKYLPMELTDKIMRMVHKMLMRDITEILTHKIVFTIYDNNRLSFLISETQNYYHLLDDNMFALLNTNLI